MGREKLLAFGVRNVPIIAKGDQFVFGQNLEQVAEFVGLQSTGHTPLPPDVLIRKWSNVLRAAQRFIRQIPDQNLNEFVIENRPRTIRSMGHHIFRIGEAYLETAVDGVEFVPMESAGQPVVPRDGTFTKSEEIADYGDVVIGRLEKWWDDLADRSCQQRVKTFFGMQPLYMLYERSTWHSAQHTRQMVAVLERLNIEPNGPLTSDDLAGLPLPVRLWE